MRTFSKTWWGIRFIEALESFTDEARLKRGKSYVRNGKILSHKIKENKITAKVRGSINPYFGVYKEPTYKIDIEFSTISKTSWSKIIKGIAEKAGVIAKLLMNEIPDNIEESIFSRLNLNLLPHSDKDIKTKCSCPDWANPCKHIAGVYYLIASELDHNPFLLFELRGISQNELQQELIKTPLGKILSEDMTVKEQRIETTDSFYTSPITEAVTEKIDIREFWRGKKELPRDLSLLNNVGVSALLIKRQGDFPPFWNRDNSFIDTMEQIYNQVRTKNKNII